MLQTFADAPPEAGMSAEVADQIMHVSLPVAGAMLMGSDVTEPEKLIAGNNFSISLMPGSREACDSLFTGVSAGGEVEMPLQDTFWGSYFSSCRDRFGVNWMFNHDLGAG